MKNRIGTTEIKSWIQILLDSSSLALFFILFFCAYSWICFTVESFVNTLVVKPVDSSAPLEAIPAIRLHRKIFNIILLQFCYKLTRLNLLCLHTLATTKHIIQDTHNTQEYYDIKETISKKSVTIPVVIHNVPPYPRIKESLITIK